MGDSIKNFAAEGAIIVSGNVIDEKVGNELIVTVIATGLGASSSVIRREVNKKVSSLEEKKTLPLSPAAREYLENPPKVGEKVEKQSKEAKQIKGDDYLDIPSFVRTQLD